MSFFSILPDRKEPIETQIRLATLAVAAGRKNPANAEACVLPVDKIPGSLKDKMLIDGKGDTFDPLVNSWHASCGALDLRQWAELIDAIYWAASSNPPIPLVMDELTAGILERLKGESSVGYFTHARIDPCMQAAIKKAEPGFTFRPKNFVPA